jgi:hypothetical protein
MHATALEDRIAARIKGREIGRSACARSRPSRRSRRALPCHILGTMNCVENTVCRLSAAAVLALTIAPALGAQAKPDTITVRIFDSWPQRTTPRPDTLLERLFWSRDSTAVVGVISRELRRLVPTDTTVGVTNLQVYGDSATAVGRWGQSRSRYSAGRFVLDRKSASWTLRPLAATDTITVFVFPSHGQ